MIQLLSLVVSVCLAFVVGLMSQHRLYKEPEIKTEQMFDALMRSHNQMQESLLQCGCGDSFKFPEEDQ